MSELKESLTTEICDPTDSVTDIANESEVCTQEDNGCDFECPKCKKKYKNKRSLSGHVRIKHRVVHGSGAKMPCRERNCNFRGSRIAGLISHLIRVHKRKFQCEKVTFQCHSDFWNWKKKAEERCRSTYSAITSARQLVSGDRKLFLRCNRSGYSKTEVDSEASSRNRRSSMKINAVCTSFMDVNFLKEGGAVVHFCKTHYGHKEDVICIRMNEDERSMIRDLIVEGLTASEIIAVMKTRVPAHRHSLLKYSNIRNLSVRQNLLMHKTRGISSLDCVVSEHSTFSQNLKSCDSAVDLKVENEEVIGTSQYLDPEVVLSPVYSHDQSSNMTSSDASYTVDTVKQLKDEIASKVQKIARVASGLVSQTFLNTLSGKLDDILDDMNDEEHFEVIPESTENYKQTSHVFEDLGGNSVSLLCSDKDVYELC